MHHLVLEDEAPVRAGGADRPAHGRGRPRERDRGPDCPTAGDRVLERRARRAYRGRPVRRRAQETPAPARLRVGEGRPAHHLRPQALQRRARLPGASRAARSAAASRSCVSSRKDALAACTDGSESTLENEPGRPLAPANDDVTVARAQPLVGTAEAARNEPGSAPVGPGPPARAAGPGGPATAGHLGPAPTRAQAVARGRRPVGRWGRGLDGGAGGAAGARARGVGDRRRSIAAAAAQLPASRTRARTAVSGKSENRPSAPSLKNCRYSAAGSSA